jgi:bacterial/archaeal transporter family protein
VKTEYFIFASIIGSGVGSFLYKYATNSLHPLMIAVFSLLTYATVLPLAFLFTKVDTTVSMTGIFYTIVSSLFLCVGTLGISFALRNGEAVGKVSAITSLYPALTLILSCLFLGEALTIKKVIGIGFAMIAVAILV